MNEEQSTINAEQAADFAALQASANDAPALPGEEAPAVSADLTKEITGLISVLVAMAGPLFPSLVTLYTPEVIQAAGGAIAAVCEKRGWMTGGIFGEWGEEIACAAIVGPLAFSSYQGIQSDMKARKKPEPARIAPTVTAGAVLAPDAPANTKGQGVTFGAPVQSVASVAGVDA